MAAAKEGTEGMEASSLREDCKGKAFLLGKVLSGTVTPRSWGVDRKAARRAAVARATIAGGRPTLRHPE